MELTKNQRIALKKQQGILKDRHSRKLERYSDNFNEMFAFFLTSYRNGLLTFAGSEVIVSFSTDAPNAKEAMKRYETGEHKQLVCRQNNVLQAVITAKKSFGLHVKMWSEGIADHDFDIQEVLDTFNEYGIKVPDCLLKGLHNEITERKIALNDIYLKNISFNKM